MPIDRTRLDEHIAAQIEAIEADHADEEDVEIGIIVTILEVVGPNRRGLRVRPSDTRPWVASGVIQWAADIIRRRSRGEASARAVGEES